MAIPNTFADKTGEVLLGNLDYNFEVLDVRISNNQTQIENLDLRIGAIEGTDVDFTGYATETYVDNAINAITLPSLSGYATETYVNNAVSSLVDSAPSTLNTLNELAAALGDDANFSTTITNSIADKASLSGAIFTGQIKAKQSTSFGSNGINLDAAGNGYLRGTDKDAASSTQSNVQLMSWWGIGFSPSISGQSVPQGENAVWINARTGTLDARSTITGGSLAVTNAATIRDVTGNYGSLEIDGGATGGWEGYSIGGWSVFMSQGTASGIYNDVNNQWILYGTHNAATDIRYAGSAKLTTTSGGVAVTGALTATGDITAYFSDERLKTKLGNIENAIDKVNQLNGFYYEANNKAVELGYTKKKEVGLSAQEIEKVLPEIVAPAPIDPEYKTIHYERVVPLLVEAIKELSARVKELENK